MALTHPILSLSHPAWSEVAAKPIHDCGEMLMPLGLAPERLLVHPVYYLDGLPGALPECYAREGVREALIAVAEGLPHGLRLVVLDAWRPFELQRYLYDQLEAVLREVEPDIDDEMLRQRTHEFVAPPSRDPTAPSPHLTGGSVDLTLCDERAYMLDMGSAFDEVTARSHTTYYEQHADNATARDNRRLLYHAMTAAGFTNLPSEWWHFDYGNQQWAWYRSETAARYGLARLPGMTERWRAQLRHVV